MSHGHLEHPLLVGDLETGEGKLRHALHLEDSVHSYPTLLPTYVPIVTWSICHMVSHMVKPQIQRSGSKLHTQGSHAKSRETQMN